MLKNNLQYFLFGLILLVHGLLLTKLIFFPYPELFIYPYLTNNGLLPYKQILDQHFPGLMFLPINFNNLGMTNPDTARIWLIAVVLITHLFLFVISRNFFKNGYKALLVNLLYLIWQPFFEGWVLWIDSFLPLILLPAFYFLYNRKFFISGIFIGLAVVFKQVMIPLAAILLFYVWWESREFKKMRDFFIGLSLPVFLMIIYLISKDVFNDFFYWTVIFNLTVFAKYGRGGGGDFAHLSRVILVFGTAFLTVGKIKERPVQILLIFLVGSLLGLTTRFDFVHFQPALPFAVILTALAAYSLNKQKMGLIFIGIYIFIALWWQNIFYKGHTGNKVFFFDEQTYKIAGKIMQYTKPKDKIFVFGAAPHLYQMTQTLPAGDIFVFQFPWFFQIAQDRILAGLKQDRPDIVVVDKTVKIEGRPISGFGSDINAYLIDNYEKIDNVGDTEILKRK